MQVKGKIVAALPVAPLRMRWTGGGGEEIYLFALLSKRLFRGSLVSLFHELGIHSVRIQAEVIPGGH